MVTGGCSQSVISCLFFSPLSKYLSEKLGGDDISIAASWRVFDVLYDFREDVLKQSQTGAHIFNLIEEQGEAAMKIIEKDGKLLRDALLLFVRGSVYCGYLTSIKRGGKVQLGPNVRLHSEFVDEWLDWMKRFRVRAAGHKFDESIALVEELLTQMRDKTPRELLAALEQPPQAYLKK